MKNKNKNICEICKHFREQQSTDVIFMERTQICTKLNIEWPIEKQCNFFEKCKNFI